MNKKLEDYSREELITEINQLKQRKKFGLVWEDKKEDVIEKCQDNIPILKDVLELAITDKPGEPTDLIIEGDNYEALSVLNYTHHGKIDVIYIDPPYNTGNKDFIYNDKYVDADDGFKHSQWLSFMERRLQLAYRLMSNEGIICISIDDNEYAYLKVLCDKIFGFDNFIGSAPRKTRGSATTKGFAELQTLGDYLLIYAKRKSELILQKKIVGEKVYPYEDDRGKYYIVPLQDNGPHGTREARPNLWYPIYELENGDLTYYEPEKYKQKILPAMHQNKEGCWMWSKPKFDRDKRDLLVKDGKMWIKHYFNPDEDQNKYQYEKLWLDEFQNAKGTKKLGEVLGRKGAFSNPKPIELVKWCVGLHVNKEAIVLDFFAGSGTTGQAVLELNQEDGGNRKFILCTNNENQIAENVTYPRIKTVVTGIRPDGTKYSDGIPANIRYLKTDFVEKTDSKDVTRAKLFEKIDDMICVRENTFEKVSEDKNYTFYKNNEKFTAIIKDPFNFGSTWYDLEKFNDKGLPVRLYVFSYSSYNFEDEIPETDLSYEIYAVPESVLEVYRKTVEKKEEK